MSKQRWVVKIGSALLTNDGKGLDKIAIAAWVKQIVKLAEQNIEVVLVSSGAITEGMKRLGWRTRPSNIYQLQAAAAVGQMGLVQAYESLFSQYNIHTAQVLLTYDNLTNSIASKNIHATFNALLDLSVVPIVNENDTVATDEITFGDNDKLAALVANLLGATQLVVLTDQGGVYDADPRQNPAAKLIDKIHVDDAKLAQVASRESGSFGSGGMSSKVLAAKTASLSNINTIIASGRQEDVLSKLGAGELIGTLITC